MDETGTITEGQSMTHLTERVCHRSIHEGMFERLEDISSWNISQRHFVIIVTCRHQLPREMKMKLLASYNEMDLSDPTASHLLSFDTATS